MIFRILFLPLLLVGCSGTSAILEPLGFYRTTNLTRTDDHSYIVKTDNTDLLQFDIIFSNSTNDVQCERGQYHHGAFVSGNSDKQEYFYFERQESPNITLYEWHMCFVIEDITYKAWRGFDPGPGRKLRATCFIPEQQLLEKNTEAYFCHLDHVELNPKNYSEYIVKCSGDNGTCRAFESNEELLLWQKLNSEDGLHDKVAYATVAHAIKDSPYMSETQTQLYLSVGGKDPSNELKNHLSELNTNVLNGSEWSYGNGKFFTISEITPISESEIMVLLDMYRGTRRDRGYTVILEVIDGIWEVKIFYLSFLTFSG